MSKRARTLAVAAMTALALFAFAARPLHAIGPTVLMFYGEPLKKTVLVTGADTVPFGDFLTPSTVTPQDTVGRGFIKVALFCGPLSNPAANGTPLEKLTPEMAWQHGRLFPATATQPALLLTTAFTKQAVGVPTSSGAAGFTAGGALTPDAVAVLRRLGVPVGPVGR